ncbi:endosome-associated-trafficking regulator 1 isoform X2 [Protopterus annectens]|uniref:endosome-associated-trafficking regulator 1 isoform X2 n=1 Tax=Protopterus annectens TaxID=7888 RepID=UPI001CF9B9A5|nr:endosome-associated-trafficking regulator 1 isoform X2 [Protopterus annectens]
MSHLKHTTSGKPLVYEDGEDKQDSSDETNPFSFKEFLKNKTVSTPTKTDKENTIKSKCEKKTPNSSLAGDDPLFPQYLGPNSNLQQPFFTGLHVECSEPFFADPTVEDHLLEVDEEEEDWSGSYQPSAVEDAHELDIFSSASDSNFEHCSSSSAEQSNANSTFATWHINTSSNTTEGSSYPTTASNIKTERDCKVYTCSVEDSSYHIYQSHGQDLREENADLRRKIKELLKREEAQTKKIKSLEEELEKRKITEETETQALESMVQQVEQNLQLMTSKLEYCRTENEALRAGDSENLRAAKQNAQLASENLHKVVNSAQSSIRQLISGAETLQVVSEQLKSISRITEVQSEGI